MTLRKKRYIPLLSNPPPPGWMGTSQSLSASGSGSASRPHITNPLTELQLLPHEGDLLHLVRIDDTRLASMSQSGDVRVWNFHTGSLLRSFFYAEGSYTSASHPLVMHLTEPQQSLLLVGVGRNLRVWDIDRGQELAPIMTPHTDGIRLLCALKEPSLVASASDDKCIFIWNIRTGQQVYKVDRSRIGSECSPVSSLLALSDSRLVVGTQKHVITVYNYEKGTHEISSMHKEPVSSLVEINDTSFASGAEDGSVFIYLSSSLSCVGQLRAPERPPERAGQKSAKKRSYAFGVRRLVPISPYHLVVVYEDGFQLFNLALEQQRDPVLRFFGSRTRDTAGLIPLYGGTRLVSCAGKGSLHLWSLDDTPSPPPIQPTRKDSTFLMDRQAQVVVPYAHAEMTIHQSTVRQLIPLSSYSFATCGSDGLVVLWKDNRIASEWRNFQTS